MKAACHVSSVVAVLLTHSARSIYAQDANVTMCSCSPTEIAFVITLNQTCETNDMLSNTGGIGGAFCFTEVGVALPAPPVVDNTTTIAPVTTSPVATASAATTTTSAPATSAVSVAPVPAMPEMTNATSADDAVTSAPATTSPVTIAPATSSPITTSPVTSSPSTSTPTSGPTTTVPTSSPTTSTPTFHPSISNPPSIVPTAFFNVTDVPEMPEMSNATSADDPIAEPVRRRSLQTTTTTSDPVVEVVSVQYLEFDTSGDLTVINQDDTYGSVSLVDGDLVTFVSASSYLDTTLPLEDQMSGPALVPGGASLIIYGKTAGGVIVRNRFFWTYDTSNCGADNVPIKVDDGIGWVTVAEFSNAWPTFCPALPDGSPTIAPKTNEPTLTPSRMPTTTPAYMSMSLLDQFSDDVGGWGTAATQPPTTSGSAIIAAPDPDSEDGSVSDGGGDAIFSSKGGKHDAKTYKPHSKGGKSKGGKSKGGKSKGGKSKGGKSGGDDYDHATGKVVGYEMRNVGTIAAPSYGWGSVTVLVASLMAGAILMARQ